MCGCIHGRSGRFVLLWKHGRQGSDVQLNVAIAGERSHRISVLLGRLATLAHRVQHRRTILFGSHNVVATVCVRPCRGNGHCIVFQRAEVCAEQRGGLQNSLP